MEIYVHKLSGEFFECREIIDFAISVIWVVRYNDPGEFELYLPADGTLVQLFEGETLLTRPNSRYSMLVESVEIESDPEEGDKLIVKGRSSESILARRVVSRQRTFAGGITEATLRSLVNEEVVASFEPERRISCVRMGTYHRLGTIGPTQVTGKNVLEKVSEICKQQNLGFALYYSETRQGYFDFTIYQGNDKTSQVIFSPDFENLGATDYSEDNTEHYTAAYVAGQGQGLDRVIVPVSDGTTGLARREVWVDARNTSSQTDSGQMSDEEYREILSQQGAETLAAHKTEVHFDGEILDANGYTYGTDYGLGDIVTVRTGYGLETTAQVVEVTEVEDEDGYKIIPTLAEWRQI